MAKALITLWNARIPRPHRGPGHAQIAYKDANLLNIASHNHPGSFAVRFRRTGSDRPEQILQLVEIGGLLLPALDTDLSGRVAEAMQQHQRRQPPLQIRRNIR